MHKNLIVFIVAFAFFCRAQDSTALKSLGLQIGPEAIVFKDLYRSPYVYRGMNTALSLSAERISGRSIHRLQANYSFGKVKTNFSPLAPQDRINIQYAYLRKLWSGPSWKLYMGPELHAQAWRVDYFPELKVPDYSKVHSYMVAASLGLNVQFNKQISARSSLQLSASMPLVNYVERPHFLDGSAARHWGTLNLWNPNVKLTYSYKIRRNIWLTISYQYTYLHYTQPKALYMLSNGLSIGVRWQF